MFKFVQKAGIVIFFKLSIRYERSTQQVECFKRYSSRHELVIALTPDFN